MNRLWIAFVVLIIAFAVYIVINERKANIEPEPDFYAIIEAKNDTIRMYEHLLDSVKNVKHEAVIKWRTKYKYYDKIGDNFNPADVELDSFFSKRYGHLVTQP